jgi:hypothetical protein
MQILLRLITPPVVAQFEKGSKPGPGHRLIFSEDVALEEYDGVVFNTPLAGSHSGFTTVLRIAKKKGRLYPKGSFLIQNEATYRFKAVPNTPFAEGTDHCPRGFLHRRQLHALRAAYGSDHRWNRRLQVGSWTSH